MRSNSDDRRGLAGEPGLGQHARVDQLLRALGVNLLGSLAARLPARAGAVVQLLLILVGSLLPLWPLLRGWIELQDLLAYSSLWLAMSVGSTLIRLNTMARRDAITRFFALHYAIMIGVLSLVCGVWSVILLFMAGVSGGWFALIPTAAALLLSHAWSLADGWFLRGGRTVTRLWQVLLPGYLRFIPVLLATIAGAVLIIGEYPLDYRFVAAAALVVVLTAIDLTLALASFRLTR